MFNRGIRDEKISGNHYDFLIEEGHFTRVFFFFSFLCQHNIVRSILPVHSTVCGGTVFESYHVVISTITYS